MKTVARTLIASSLVATFAIASNALYADSSGHGSGAMHFDPVATEFGAYEPDMHATKTVEIKMKDEMRFSPDVIQIKAGDVVKLIHTNTGQMMHELVLGTKESLDEHAEMMKKFPGMEHEEPYMSHVKPGDTGEIIWKFTEAGEFSFGCLIPGHYDAGMQGKIIVES